MPTHSIECLYRAVASMATNYADTAREVALGLTDVKLEDLTLPTVENAAEWASEFGCDGSCVPMAEVGVIVETLTHGTVVRSSVFNNPELGGWVAVADAMIADARANVADRLTVDWSIEWAEGYLAAYREAKLGGLLRASA